MSLLVPISGYKHHLMLEADSAMLGVSCSVWYKSQLGDLWEETCVVFLIFDWGKEKLREKVKILLCKKWKGERGGGEEQDGRDLKDQWNRQMNERNAGCFID